VPFWEGPLLRVTLVKSRREVPLSERAQPFMWNRICASGRHASPAADAYLTLAAVHARYLSD
jgi:hypothetical protein